MGCAVQSQSRLIQLEARAVRETNAQKAEAEKFIHTRRGRSLLQAVAKGYVLASWNNPGMKLLASLGLVESHILLSTKGQLSVSKIWTITDCGRAFSDDGL